MAYSPLAIPNCRASLLNLPLLTGAISLTQRLRRLLTNQAIEPTLLYRPVARFLLLGFASASTRLTLDTTDLGGRLLVLLVAMAYRGRAFPLAVRTAMAKHSTDFFKTFACARFY